MTTETELPYGDRFTPRARRTVEAHAEKAAEELRQPLIGTEALLLALWAEPQGLAARALTHAGADRASTLAALEPLLPPGGAFEGGYTYAASTALQLCWRIAVALGHNYLGTEHVLIALLSMDADDPAARALDALGVRLEETTAFVKNLLKQ